LLIHQEQHDSKNKKGKASQENQNKHDLEIKNSSRVTKNEKSSFLSLSPPSYTNS
jgi:hypothetical protein